MKISHNIGIYCLLSGLIAATPPHKALSQTSVDYRGEIWLNAGSGDFAPYGIMSNRYGVTTQPSSIMVRGALKHEWDTTARWSWTAGADIIAQASSATDYARYQQSSKSWTERGLRPSAAHIQQLFAGIRYRSVFAIVGLKEYPSAILNDSLSSGDFTRGINARPMPGVSFGLWRFVDIPFTRGALQISGEIFYGRPTDSRWLEDHYNYYSSFINTNWWYNYKRLYFRTKPSLPVSVTFGMQAACQLGYNIRHYFGGNFGYSLVDHVNLWETIEMLLPSTGEGYWRGNHLGSWDLMARWRMPSGHQLKAYFQWPWEDGSGIGRRNGWDGIWGIEYVAASPRSIISGAIIEYLDFTNQSGPTHWAPHDRPGTTITDEATGSDSYYNNANYNGYTYFGMGLGTPFLPGTVYNRDGYMCYVDTRVRGFHMAAKGWLASNFDYRVMLSYRQGWGDYYAPRTQKVHDFSWMLEAAWHVSNVPGLKVSAIAAMDHGDMIGNNIGGAISLTYTGSFTLGNHGK